MVMLFHLSSDESSKYDRRAASFRLEVPVISNLSTEASHLGVGYLLGDRSVEYLAFLQSYPRDLESDILVRCG
jgi:hypothetical protein